MLYKSTRGGEAGLTFEQTLFSGVASDGGLYVPERLPEIPKDLLAKWKTTPPKYQDVVFEIIKLFVSEQELPRNVLQNCVDRAYSTFDIESVIGLHQCKGPDSDGSPEYTVAEMFRGKTKSFKDYSLSLIGRLMEYYVDKRRSHVTAVVGTSGDTGSAAIESLKGVKGIDIIVIFPQGKISEVQELQMTTILEDNVHVLAAEGTTDDLDIPIKKSFPAPGLISINSLNWTRIMIQISHYIYLCALEHLEPVDIYVPTGGAGNLVSGLLVSLLGIPINLFSTQNVNNNVEKLINKGELVYGGELIETYANAMDILSSYNVERILYLFSDSDTVAKLMTGLEGSDQVGEVSQTLHKKIKRSIKGALKVDDAEMLEMIRECWNSNKYLICPHTATAVALFLRNAKSNGASKNRSFVLGTASPEKFPEAVKAANLSGAEFTNGGRLLQHLRSRQRKQPKLMKKGEDWLKILQAEVELARKAYGNIQW